MILLVLASCGRTPQAAVREGSCDGAELNALLQTCVGFGGQFAADAAASGLEDCSGGVAVVVGGGACKIQGAGGCSVACILPECPGPDSDADGVPDSCDVCSGGDDRLDRDLDGAADACDPCPSDLLDDSDDDGICDSDDVCRGEDDREDSDGDAVPDGCDSCPDDPSRVDSDGDGVGDACDACPLDSRDDDDGDGTCDSEDQCPGSDDRLDADLDRTPDGCDPCLGDNILGDADGDGMCGDTTFEYSGLVEAWTVPTGVSTLRVYVWGAGGGGGGGCYELDNECNGDLGSGGDGGGGAFVTGVLAVAGGDVLELVVGEGGGADYRSVGAVWSAFGGGGEAGNANSTRGAGGGGGYSGISRQGTWLVVSGGGGGGATSNFDGLAIQGAGGAGGGEPGQDGALGVLNGGGGEDGQVTRGGYGGDSFCGELITLDAVDGRPLRGGAGAATEGANARAGGGGGGGGWFGGGGGGGACGFPEAAGGGGGGGTSYAGSLVQATLESGSGTQPGGVASVERGAAGEGGAFRTPGNHGRIVIRLEP